MSVSCTPTWVLGHLGIRYPALFACACSGYIAVTSIMETQTGSMVSFTFDDGRESVLVVEPELDKHEMRATVFPHTLDLNATGFMRDHDYLRFVAKGWEVGSHTITHPDLTKLDPVDLTIELVNSKAVLESITGLPVFSFSSPFGEFKEREIAAIAQQYDTHVNAWSPQRGINDIETFDPLNIHRLDVTSDVTPEEVCDIVKTLDDGEWFVMIFHQFKDGYDPTNKWTYDTAAFKQIVECVELSKHETVTITEGADRMFK